ncbi:gliding motility-associated ABC transporter substrate-binding protein GldG [Taibaiella sp. KBW10]|uniref:gliding motility-associated ABC transporter substrate-binding protein GldG n=1 Tax=Taibaiella sp. KBW10 TaxID=2153357 RepID=UPI000F5A0D65|nr:gliding motility-associated ABC transporter substrate-binding protein GldG [Taibaiella sp. KBW10]RQO30556.1 gliding motility-associated ABC transporter substrate-binding protein GldG [Taibaiella sp. KBW10]
MSDIISNDKKKKQLLIKLLGVIALLVLINVASYRWSTQLDLTRDQKYSTTKATQQFLNGLKGKAHITVFLKGNNIPAAFKNLSVSTEELLKTFSHNSNDKISYDFVDPIEDDDTAIIGTLARYNMTGFPVTVNGKAGSEQKMVFPWALVRYKPENGAPERIMPVFLQESNSMVLSKTILNRSEMLLEYNLANALFQLQKDQPDFIAYLTGNEEAFGPEIRSLVATIGRQYGLDTVNLQSQVALNPAKYKAVIINRPFKAFSDIDLFKIDQYIMQGGKVLFSIDAVRASIDSFAQKETFIGMPTELGLNDMLFHYGARINNDLVLDAANNAGIPVASGGQAQQKMFSWPYFPVLQAGASQHPITKNLDGVLARFASSIDLNKNNDKVSKTALLTSSAYSKTEGAPAAIMYKSVLEEPNPATFTKKNLVVAALLEGKFTSAFLNQYSDNVKNFMAAHNLIFKSGAAKDTKIIVLSDADILLNEVSEADNKAMELGVYRFNKTYRFDNVTFLQNCLTYLIDDHNLLEARAKSFENRILDPKRTEAERSKWQMIAIGLPLVLVALLAIIYLYLRKRKYTKNA